VKKKATAKQQPVAKTRGAKTAGVAAKKTTTHAEKPAARAPAKAAPAAGAPLGLADILGSGCWLMKTEPDEFSFEDMIAKKGRTAPWDGVRNYTARNFLRDSMRVGDRVLVYHSSCDVPGVYGLGEIASAARPDPTALDPKSDYFDEKSARDGVSQWSLVDVRATARLAKPVTLEQMRAVPELAEMLVLRRGVRLSVQPVAKKHWDVIVRLGEAKPL
jgi:predicted RNA-binding protein with PUA-like domain